DLLTDFSQFPEPDHHIDVGQWVRKNRNLEGVPSVDGSNGRCSMAFNEYIAGAVGGMAGVLVGHPFDTMKLQMQIRTVGEHNVSKISEAWSCISSQGLKKGIFRGMMFPFCSYGVVNSLLFGVYGKALDYLEPDMTVKPSYFQVYTAGCMAGTAQLVLACPMEVVKCTLQAQIPVIKPSSVLHGKPAEIKHYHSGPLECTKDILRREGIRGLYKGLMTMFFRDVPSFGLYLLVYEWLHQHMIRTEYSDGHGIIAAIFSGGTAGCVSWAAIMPFDVIKSRLQVDHSLRYKGFMDCLINTVKKSGISVLYRGTMVTMLRAFPVNAITFVVYSQVLRELNIIYSPRKKEKQEKNVS
ncbi:solute carrier family 25 member 45, partial [Biomphalaria glabrata]